ncbi:hypothetical protein [Reinekea sp. G2M2-21]|uniref:hypothetical protein n=1 Tax=Reinekea sp. G2M2-21 TaxID=2788942 RepID=UPI0018AB3164|nr:hypothetical protein [Reinekea sp. G2M2-21]
MKPKNISKSIFLYLVIFLSSCTVMTGREALNIDYPKSGKKNFNASDMNIDLTITGRSILLANNSEYSVFIPTSFASQNTKYLFPLVWTEKCLFSNKTSMRYYENSELSIKDDEYVGFFSGFSFERLPGRSTSVIELGVSEYSDYCDLISYELEVYSQSAINSVFGEEFGEMADIIFINFNSYVELLKYNRLLYSETRNQRGSSH